MLKCAIKRTPKIPGPVLITPTSPEKNLPQNKLTTPGSRIISIAKYAAGKENERQMDTSPAIPPQNKLTPFGAASRL